MITSKYLLRSIIKSEKRIYFSDNKEMLIMGLISDPKFLIWRYVVSLRKLEYWHGMWHKNNRLYSKFMWVYCRYRHNRRGIKLGIDIWDNSIDRGLMIWHAGSIIINGNAKIGSNCTIHGAVCIGNNGKSSKCPTIGDNVDIGVGSYILGNVKIPDNTVIGAGAVVVSSFQQEGLTLVGIPAHPLKGLDEE